MKMKVSIWWKEYFLLLNMVNTILYIDTKAVAQDHEQIMIKVIQITIKKLSDYLSSTQKKISKMQLKLKRNFTDIWWNNKKNKKDKILNKETDPSQRNEEILKKDQDLIQKQRKIEKKTKRLKKKRRNTQKMKSSKLKS